MAVQFVVEEKIMSQYSVAPLVAVGFEGFFGALTIVLVAPLLYTFRDSSPFFDLPRGWRQMTGNPKVLAAGGAIALSIAAFNFCGLSVTRHISATARSVIDNIRTLAMFWKSERSYTSINTLRISTKTRISPVNCLECTDQMRV